MTKNTKTNSPVDVKKRQTKKIMTIIGIVLGVYIIGLINPFTSLHLQYPYYELFCGHKPVIASSFMARTYHTSNMESYRIGSPNDRLYCTEDEAQSDGYRKSRAQYK